MLKKITSALLLTTILTACGGGGGGGGSGDDDDPSFTGFTPELRAIGADYATSYGYTGNGVTVAVIDDGFNLNHEALKDNFISGWDFANGDSNPEADSDSDFHGTMVASSVAAQKPDGTIIGVAYNASLMPLKVWDGVSLIGEASAVNYAVANGADIINISFGGWSLPSSAYSNAIKGAANAGLAITFAAGNDSASTPITDVSQLVSDAGGYAVAVVALNNSGTSLAGFSNKCGNVGYCLAAPGVNSYLATVDGGYGYAQGTSFAAPMVAGVLAALKEVTNMNGKELIGVLIQTADDMGTAGYDTTYGYGRVNVEEAFKIQGVMSVPTGKKINDSEYVIDKTSIKLSSSFGDALQGNKLLAKAVGFDELNKPFKVDLNNNVSQADYSLDLLGFIEKQGKFSEHEVKTETVSLGFGIMDRSDEQIIAEPTQDFNKQEVTYVKISHKINDRLNFDFSSNQRMGLTEEMPELLSTQAFFDPYLNNKQAVVTYKLSDRIDAKFIATSDDDIKDNTMSSAFNYYGNDYVLNFQVGFKNEENGFLGAETDGAFSSDSASTSFFSVGGIYKISDNLNLMGSYTNGVSKLSSNSLIDNFSNVRSNSYSLGLVSQHKNKSFGAVFSQPLKVYSASADLTVPVWRDEDQNVIYETERTDLVASGTEKDIELFYNQNISNNETLSLNTMARIEPGHVKTNDNEYIVTAKYSLNF